MFVSVSKQRDVRGCDLFPLLLTKASSLFTEGEEAPANNELFLHRDTHTHTHTNNKLLAI